LTSALSGSTTIISGSVKSTGSFGSIYIDKNVNASSFVGDGSSLTGIDIPTAAAISGSVVSGVSGSVASTGSFGRVEAAGDVELKAGNLIIGTHGKGIDFSANTDDAGGMTAEILDDYEEGTWTPSDVSGAAPALSLTVSGNANYVKIGQLVWATALIDYPSNSDGNYARISLPFTAHADSVGGKTGGVGMEESLSGTVTFPVEATYTVIRVDGATAQTNTDCSTKGFRYFIIYRAAS
jgi:hypothetical protein